MPVYRRDVKLAGTLYVKAKSASDADAKMRDIGRKLQNVDVQCAEEGQIPVSGERYSSPKLPEISLSPAMTLHDWFDTNSGWERADG